jgi:RHS repeat-associated protein
MIASIEPGNTPGTTLSINYAYNAANQMTYMGSGIQGGSNFAYDANGNMTDFGGEHYNWNFKGQLTSATNVNNGNFGGGNVYFGYDSLGRRTGSQRPDPANGMNTITRSTTWDGWGEREVSEGTTGGNMFGLGMTSTTTGLPTGIFNLGDSGSTTLLGYGAAQGPSQGGTIDFSPYGRVVGATGTGSDEKNVRYAGMIPEPGTNLYYARNRFYHPAMGRFISEDPIGFDGGLNLYAYCGGDPVNFSDPLGLSPEDWSANIGGPNGLTFSLSPNLNDRYINIGGGNGFTLTREGIHEGASTGFNAVRCVVSGGWYDGGSYRCKPGFEVSWWLATIGVFVMPGPAGDGVRYAQGGMGLAAHIRDGDADSGPQAIVSMGGGRTIPSGPPKIRGGAPGTRGGKIFSPAGKEEVLKANRTKNGGTIVKCEECGTDCVQPLKSMGGVKDPSPKEWQIDHIIAKSNGGSGTPDNGQVLCRKCNRTKWDN